MKYRAGTLYTLLLASVMCFCSSYVTFYLCDKCSPRAAGVQQMSRARPLSYQVWPTGKLFYQESGSGFGFSGKQLNFLRRILHYNVHSFRKSKYQIQILQRLLFMFVCVCLCVYSVVWDTLVARLVWSGSSSSEWHLRRQFCQHLTVAGAGVIIHHD